MLVHILVSALAQSTLAHMPDMVVMGVVPNYKFLIPNHEKRGVLSRLTGVKGQSHSFIVDEMTYNFNCQAGYDLFCHCSMEVVSTSDPTRRLKKKEDCNDIEVRDSQGRCLVVFHPGFEPVYSFNSFVPKVENFGSCIVWPPKNTPERPETLSTVALQTYLVPRQPVAWAVTIDGDEMAIKCGTEEKCVCSMMQLHTATENFGYVPCSSGETPPSRDSAGNCRVKYELLKVSMETLVDLSSAKTTCKTLDAPKVESSPDVHDLSAISRMPEKPRMVVVDLKMISSGAKTFKFLIPKQEEKRGLISVVRGAKPQPYTFIDNGMTLNFQCNPDPDTCICFVDAQDSKGAARHQVCRYTSKRDDQGRCLVEFKPIFTPTLEHFGICTVQSPTQIPEMPHTLHTVALRTFKVPRQSVDWIVAIGKDKMAIKCGTGETCACSMSQVTHSNEMVGYTSCPSVSLASRDSVGNCRVSYDISPSASKGTTCKTLGDAEMKQNRDEYFQIVYNAIQDFNRVPVLTKIEYAPLAFDQVKIPYLESLGISETDRDAYKSLWNSLTDSFESWTHSRLTAMESILTELEVPDLKSWRDKVEAWRAELKELDTQSSDADLKARGALLLDVAGGIQDLIRKVDDKLVVFVKSPAFKEKSKLELFDSTWKEILYLKQELDGLKTML